MYKYLIFLMGKINLDLYRPLVVLPVSLRLFDTLFSVF